MKYLLIPLLACTIFHASAQDNLKTPVQRNKIGIAIGPSFFHYYVPYTINYFHFHSNSWQSYTAKDWLQTTGYCFSFQFSHRFGKRIELGIVAQYATTLHYFYYDTISRTGKENIKHILIPGLQANYRCLIGRKVGMYTGISLSYINSRVLTPHGADSYAIGIHAGIDYRIRKSVRLNLEPAIKIMAGDARGYIVPVLAGVKFSF